VVCKRVINIGNRDIFVSTRTDKEWSSIRNAISAGRIAGVSLAECDIDPPVINWQLPVFSWQSWYKNSQIDFETAGYVNNQTNTSASPGNVILANSGGGSSFALTQTDDSANTAAQGQTGGWLASGSVSTNAQVVGSGSAASVGLAQISYWNVAENISS
jgi:hypothetical protein